jgi:adenosine deaminase CECR1
MVGKADMGLFGWKQLVLWSIRHACLSNEELERVLEGWEVLWDEFLHKVCDEFGSVLEKDKPASVPT